MAQLTLSQRIQMASTPLFQDRMKAALIHISEYWKNRILVFSLEDTGGNSGYNRRNQLRITYANRILRGEIPNLESFCLFFLQRFEEDVAVTPTSAYGGAFNGIPWLNSDNQINDKALIFGAWLDPSFDYFAGVLLGHESDLVIL